MADIIDLINTFLINTLLINTFLTYFTILLLSAMSHIAQSSLRTSVACPGIRKGGGGAII